MNIGGKESSPNGQPSLSLWDLSQCFPEVIFIVVRGVIETTDEKYFCENSTFCFKIYATRFTMVGWFALGNEV